MGDSALGCEDIRWELECLPPLIAGRSVSVPSHSHTFERFSAQFLPLVRQSPTGAYLRVTSYNHMGDLLLMESQNHPCFA